MNIITLTNGYFIEIDELNHTLKQNYIAKKKDGTKYRGERVCGYFGKSLDGAIGKYLKLNQIDLMNCQAMEMEEYVKMVKRINDETVQAIKSIVEGRK